MGHGRIESGRFGEGIRECSAFLTMIAANGGLVARGDVRESSGVLHVIVNRLVKPADLLEGDVKVETPGDRLDSVLRACQVKLSKT
jgi:hypothetical protein